MGIFRCSAGGQLDAWIGCGWIDGGCALPQGAVNDEWTRRGYVYLLVDIYLMASILLRGRFTLTVYINFTWGFVSRSL